MKTVAGLLAWLVLVGAAQAQAPSPAQPQWLRVPPVTGRLTAADIAVVINTADPYSVAVGEHYAQRRGLSAEQVVRVELPLRPSLSPAEFDELQAQLQRRLPSRVQALALAWSQPYAVACNSITGALALGFQAELCKQSCAPSKPSPYVAYTGHKPFSDLGLRPAMLLAARSVEQARALIDRGVAADHSLAQRGTPPVQAVFASTADKARNVRAPLFPPPGRLWAWGVEVRQLDQDQLPPLAEVVLYQTGLARVEGLDQIPFLPGALADHLTSLGGQLERTSGPQMSALDWLAAGATASHGAVSEPCNHLQKFPHPQLLLLNYLQGVSALEAYWRSVLWPAQSVFVGEPLAAPFARQPDQP
ncbi:TIGR03790 family protein [Paucibacter sp. XJ19-41]|uniref:TIGR03790 family protein n=1 Tax=Paucibacter sp. XJ19-41 TaxID=2927824 RepID=UPI0023496DDE|nr:TIGR03790 family protein [Paucibacter sp. XJ19-41]MDC6169105.1 TIGR03790 family protein [Paucibacter sp. XJ19-41]